MLLVLLVRVLVLALARFITEFGLFHFGLPALVGLFAVGSLPAIVCTPRDVTFGICHELTVFRNRSCTITSSSCAGFSPPLRAVCSVANVSRK